MKIVLFLNKDLEANIAYNLLKKHLLKHTVRIYYSDTVGNPTIKPSDLLALEYYEKDFLFKELSKFQEKHKTESSFEFFDEDFKTFPLEKCSNVNSIAFQNEIKNFSPDLFISIRFGKIFKEEIINIPKLGILNLHSGILPDYRGIMGTLHSIKEGNKKIGCTLHTIPNSGIDTGEIIEIATLEVSLKKSLFWHIIQLYPLGANLIVKALENLEQNIAFKSQEQNLAIGSYFSVPTKSDFDEIKNLGMEIISDKEYVEVLEEFVLNDLSKTEKEDLLQCIKNSRASVMF